MNFFFSTFLPSARDWTQVQGVSRLLLEQDCSCLERSARSLFKQLGVENFALSGVSPPARMLMRHFALLGDQMSYAREVVV